VNPLPIARMPRNPLRRRERRANGRDRRVLTGTMKYQGQFFSVEVLNLSPDGAYLVSPIIPNMADSILLTIEFPDQGEAIMVAGRVRQLTLGSRLFDRPTGFGVEFLHFFTRAGQKSLQAHLEI
jgi:hypothetical protein